MSPRPAGDLASTGNSIRAGDPACMDLTDCAQEEIGIFDLRIDDQGLTPSKGKSGACPIRPRREDLRARQLSKKSPTLETDA